VALDRLAAVGDPQLRAALLYARAQREPFTADDAAASLGVHITVARRRLDRLAEAGFLAVAQERRGGRRGPGAGRPAKVYRVAAELQGVEFPDRRYGALVGLLLEKIPERGRQRALREAGEAFGRRLAATARLQPLPSARAGLEQVCEALGALGFQVSVHSLEAEKVVLATPTCPVRPLVVEQPAAGEIDRGMWAGLVESSVRGINVDDVASDVSRCHCADASCRIVVSFNVGSRTSFPGARAGRRRARGGGSPPA